MVKTDRSDVSKGKRAANPNGRTLRASKRAEAVAPASLPPSDYHLSNLPHIPLQKIMRFLDAQSLEKIRRGSRSLNEFVVLNRSRLAWRRVHDIKMTRAFDLEKKIIYHVEILGGIANFSYIKTVDFCKTDCTKGSPSTTVALKWLATNLANCFTDRLDLREFCFDEEDIDEVAQTMAERNLRVHKLLLWNADIQIDSTSFIRFLNTINPLEVTILMINTGLDLHSLLDESFFSYMAKLEKLEIHSTPMFIRVPDRFDKIPKKFISYDVLLMPLSTVLNAIRVIYMATLPERMLISIVQNWYDGSEEFGKWDISISTEECPNLEHIAKAAELSRCRVTHKGTRMSIRNPGGKKIRVNSFSYTIAREMQLKIERC